ncbi:MAG: hypothetical protein ABFR89_07120 [Actinomycetota bacterium]
MRQRAAVRLSDAREGHFPPICVLTGEPATGTRTKTLAATTYGSDWAWPLLLVFGLIIFVISRFVSTKTVTVDLPVSDEAGSLWLMGGHIDGDWLWLSGIHAKFARALGEQYADLTEDQLPSA